MARERMIKMGRFLDAMTHIGNSHVKRGMPCQDRAIAVRNDDLVILAVADGMGSYEKSELGAEFAVNFVREHAKQMIGTLRIKEGDNGSIVWEQENGNRAFNKNIRAAMFDLQKGLINHARTLKISPDDLHCTLSFSIISPEALVNVSIGDSPLYTLMDTGPRFMDGNDNGSDRKNLNQTFSVVDMDYSINYTSVEIGLTKHLRSVLITSDGAMGWSKQERLLNSENFGDLPAWYYDMLAGKADLKTTVKKLVEEGYDDVGVAYYVHDKSLRFAPNA
jgi:flavin reductase (DIM6/NTAB) family NADH-FMN oxidoreductase RutF